MRFYSLFLYELSGIWYTILLFSGLLSVFWGIVAALNQVNIKRLYAYSAIVNVGYLLVTLSYGTFSGFVSVFNYFIVYFVST